ncbi:MAG: universal stress protein UspA [Candidatus Rokuibacteriota bacterium]|nr:MAG: universal stress protein UspA [Candidatus Rokubacteria bacterium]PYN57791.1 MAG: universal stress protein UspA [Candidatus Rokubacteria bacterium]
MFKHICVPVDNSEYSNRAIDLAVELGRPGGAKLTGVHVYAARLHDYRFKQMEYTLPEEYKDENELERQRKIHDSLIAMGLQLISESYLDVMARKAGAAGLAFESKMIDGKHYKVLIDDCLAADYDLVVMGALGMGAVKDSQLGSVTERFVRRVSRDTLIVRNTDALKDQQGPIVVCLDGSPQSFNGLQLGVGMAKALGRPLQAVAVYDPYLHYAMFNGIVGVLSEKASKIFRFKEQEQLHEEIIDTGLAKIYQSHLEIGRKLAADSGVELAITLLDGKCFEKILTFVRKEHPWLLILGRVGVHSDENEVDLGSNTENLLRLAPCNVLLTGGKFYPPLDVKAEEIISWTEEAEARMERVPLQVKGVARTALLRYAIEQGHTVITNKVIDEAMAIFMPTRLAERMQILAEDVAVAKLRAESQPATAICSICGYTVKGPNPVVTCPVCRAGADKFQVISKETVEAIAAQEGGIEEEESMPGVQVKWSADARDALREVTDAYLRRRAKARIEKYARSRRIPVITCQLALPMIEETVGRDKLGAGWDTLLAKTKFEPAEMPSAPAPAGGGPGFGWTDEATARLNRVPAGFMRDMTREEVERVAGAKGVTTIDLAVCEEGIGHARETMNEVIAGYVSNKKPR